MAGTPRFKPGKHLHAKAYLLVSHLEASFSLSCTQAAFTTLNICSHGPKQTDKQIYKRANIQMYTFRKTILGNQVHTWFKNFFLQPLQWHYIYIQCSAITLLTAVCVSNIKFVPILLLYYLNYIFI